MSLKPGSGASNTSLPGRITTLVAKFSSVCKCGSFIEPGDTMSYDILNRKALCFACVKHEQDVDKKNSVKNARNDVAAKAGSYSSERGQAEIGNESKTNSGAGSNSETEKCYPLIDRFRELRAGIRPLSEDHRNEMVNILVLFKTEFGGSQPVRNFVSAIAKCKHVGAECAVIKARYTGACIHCRSVSQVGELVLYDHHARRIHCLNCDCMRGL